MTCTHFIINKTESLSVRSGSKKLIFEHSILIKDIFHKNALKHLRYSKLLDEVHMEGIFRFSFQGSVMYVI